MSVSTRLVYAMPPAIAEAGALIRAGALVAFPTETVYGLGANALDPIAVGRIFAAKGRPHFNPLIVHVPDREEAEELALFHPIARSLAEAFWPGGLTLVLPRREPSPVALLVSGGLNTLALRSPAHTIARALIEAAGVPIAAPSANRSGRITPTTAAAVEDEMNGRIDMILDGGPCPVGIESTVIGFRESAPVLLRAGAIARADIERVAGRLKNPYGAVIEGPGMMASHYAPQAKLRLDVTDLRDGEALLAFGPGAPKGAVAIRNLSRAGDMIEAAANLFTMLRELDRLSPTAIAVMPIPHDGLGEAINDRLARAAAPRQKSP